MKMRPSAEGVSQAEYPCSPGWSGSLVTNLSNSLEILSLHPFDVPNMDWQTAKQSGALSGQTCAIRFLFWLGSLTEVGTDRIFIFILESVFEFRVMVV